MVLLHPLQCGGYVAAESASHSAEFLLGFAKFPLCDCQQAIRTECDALFKVKFLVEVIPAEPKRAACRRCHFSAQMFRITSDRRNGFHRRVSEIAQ